MISTKLFVEICIGTALGIIGCLVLLAITVL